MSTTRVVEQSLFPDIQPDKPVGAILPSVFVGTNSDLMAAVAPYYLQGSVMDCTYGEGSWWQKYRPDPFVMHDLYKGDGVDYTALPEADGTYDAVVFDPPYIPQGGDSTSTAQNFIGRFGLVSRSLSGLYEMNAAGMAECARVVNRDGFLLMKCNDFVNGGTFTLGHKWALDQAKALGLFDHDLIIHHTGSGPGGHNIFTPIRARRHHSYLLVFTKVKR